MPWEIWTNICNAETLETGLDVQKKSPQLKKKIVVLSYGNFAYLLPKATYLIFANKMIVPKFKKVMGS